MMRHGKYLLLLFMFMIVDTVISAEVLIDHGDGTITDPSSGLMWQKNGDRYLTWKKAHKYCEDLVLAGKSDWRLPNLKELQSLVDYSRTDPAVNTAYFPNTNPSNYWTKTEYAGNDRFVWYVNFYNGHVSAFDQASDYCVRCVQGAGTISHKK